MISKLSEVDIECASIERSMLSIVNFKCIRQMAKLKNKIHEWLRRKGYINPWGLMHCLVNVKLAINEKKYNSHTGI